MNRHTGKLAEYHLCCGQNSALWAQSLNHQTTQRYLAFVRVVVEVGQNDVAGPVFLCHARHSQMPWLAVLSCHLQPALPSEVVVVVAAMETMNGCVEVMQNVHVNVTRGIQKALVGHRHRSHRHFPLHSRHY